MHPKPSKTELVELICKYDPSWKEKRGRLHYLTKDELIEKYIEIRKRIKQ